MNAVRVNLRIDQERALELGRTFYGFAIYEPSEEELAQLTLEERKTLANYCVDNRDNNVLTIEPPPSMPRTRDDAALWTTISTTLRKRMQHDAITRNARERASAEIREYAADRFPELEQACAESYDVIGHVLKAIVNDAIEDLKHAFSADDHPIDTVARTEDALFYSLVEDTPEYSITEWEPRNAPSEHAFNVRHEVFRAISPFLDELPSSIIVTFEPISRVTLPAGGRFTGIVIHFACPILQAKVHTLIINVEQLGIRKEGIER